MKALVYTAPERLSLREVPEPRPGAGDVLVRIDACGICGSDMHAFFGHDERRPAPLILGHEAAGVIAMGARAGERVAINPLVSCMHCAACLGGRQESVRGTADHLHAAAPGRFRRAGVDPGAECRGGARSSSPDEGGARRTDRDRLSRDRPRLARRFASCDGAASHRPWRRRDRHGGGACAEKPSACAASWSASRMPVAAPGSRRRASHPGTLPEGTSLTP